MTDAHEVHIVTTGGTIDKAYMPLDGSLGFTRSQIAAQLGLAGAQCPVSNLMAIDSLDMDDTHRHRILDTCRQCPEQRILVTHGTDTMVETATVLAGARLDKTIVLTGAMVPLSVVGSDGPFNLGFALACARVLPAGIWVAMNGIARPWDNVRKDRQQGRFTGLDPSQSSRSNP